MLKFILLGFLTERPMTGYELTTHINQATVHFWHAYHSQIYTILRKMESEGSLTVDEQDEGDSKLVRRVYRISPQGEREFDAWINESMTELPQIKEAFLVRTFFSARRDKNAVLDELHHQRRLHQAQLEEYQRIADDPPLTDNYVAHDRDFRRMTLMFGIQFETMYLAWLHDVIAQVKNF